MREVDGEEAELLTFFLYEEITAMLRAAADVGLKTEEIADIFYNNAKRMLESTGFHID